MSSLIEQELEARGVAQVIVVLKSQDAAAGIRSVARRGGARAAALESSDASRGVASHFVSSELSLDAQIAGSGLRAATSFGITAAVADSARARASRSRATPPPPVRYYPNLGVLLGFVDQAGLAALSKDDRVAEVTATPPISPIWPERVAAAKLRETFTWGLTALKAPDFWAQGLTGKGIRIGHLDTGVDGTHPALKTAIAEFAEFDTLGELTTPTPDPHDTGEHGTHTAATIAGRAVRGKNIGVAPGAELVSAIVIEGGNLVARVLGGMDWALGKGIRILSMSLGFRGWWNNFIPIVQILRSKNVLPVMAVGNEGPGTSRSPGNYPNVLSVGAAGQDGLIANFSSSQKFLRDDDPLVPDIVGPGVAIVSAAPGGGYQEMDGTSMATPHIAGLAALLMEAEPNAGIDAVETAIFKSCQLATGTVADRANRGFPDALAAYQTLTGKEFPAKKKSAPKKKKSK